MTPVLWLLWPGCHRTDGDGPGHETDTTDITDTTDTSRTDTATGGLVCEPRPTTAGMAPVLPVASVTRLEIVGERTAELGTDVACTESGAGLFGSAVAAGGWEVDDPGGSFGWVAVVSGERTGRLPVEQADMVLRGSGTNDDLGTRVVFPGDVDGDGVGELLVTAISAFRPEHTSGAAFLFEVTPGWFEPEDAAVHFAGGEPGARLGGAAWAGDLDGDGRDEVLLGYTYMDIVQGLPGFLAIHQGRSFPATVPPDDATVQFPAVDTYQATGWEMLAADLDGDGQRDLAHGEFNWKGVFSQGRVTILTGPLLDGPPRTLEDAEIIIEGDADAEQSSTGSHLAAGDLNGDGLDDLVISAPVSAGVAGERAGKVYVFFGPIAHGLRSVTDADLVLEGDTAFAWLGDGLSILDHDGDGQQDLAIAAPVDPYFPTGCPGRIYLFRGPLQPGTLRPETDAAVIYEDDLVAVTFGESMAACDLDGDGDDELVIGSPWASPDDIPAAGRVHVTDGGSWP